MKILILVFQNVKNIITKHTLLLVVVFLSISVSVFGILFYTGYTLGSYYAVTDDDLKITLESNASKNEVKQIVEKIEKLTNDKLVRISLYDKEEVKENMNVTKESIPIVGNYNKLEEKYLRLGRYFKRDENSPVMILQEDDVVTAGFNEQPVGKFIEINKKKFKIIGMLSYTKTEGFVIPIDYFIENYKTLIIECEFTNALAKDTGNKLNSFLAENKFVENFKLPNSESPFVSFEFLIFLVQILGIFSVAIVNIFTMIHYWIKRSKTTYRIYSICGCSRKKQVLIIILQCFIIISISAIFGALLFAVCNPAFKMAEIQLKATFLDYLIISLIIFIMMMFFTIRTAVLSTKDKQIYLLED